MSDERPSQTSEQRLRMWAVEQAVKYTAHKQEFNTAGAITRIATVIYDYVQEGKVLR